MKKVTLFNIKGGVGKTTSTINIAAILAKQGNRVLIVDLDPQANVSMTFNSYNIKEESISHLLMYRTNDVEKVIKSTDYENIHVLPSNINLIQTETELLVDTSRAQQTRLRKILSSVEDKYDYCLIDCPTHVSMLALNALSAADLVMVPIKIDRYALDGLDYLIDKIDEVRVEFNPNLKFGGCFITMYSATNVNKQIKSELKDMLEDLLYETSIRQNVAVVESTFMQKPLIDYKKKSYANIDYEKLVKEAF